MYLAKEKGKNQTEFFTQALYSKISERLSLQGDLHRALKDGEFVLHYQPRINLFTGQWSGVEALVRWQHPQHGLISPLTFIPLAEETGLIMQLGVWVLRNACHQLHRWHCEGIHLARISVNVSPIQFRRQNIVELVKNAISEASLCTQALELEITESALMDNMEQAVSILRQLQNMGVNISIDDFGTGYSSLSHLRTLPVNILKIDRSFLLNAHELKEDAKILSAIIAMAHSLNLEVVAEGVECEKHEALLYAQGCREAQGFYYARPMPAEELAHMLRKNNQSLQSLARPIFDDNRQSCCVLKEPCGDASGQVCLQIPYRPAACQGKIFCEASSAQLAA
jgi:EAL domain-containing protein (putative c-di-GMP-specific phosphodiesterase class I)